MLRLNYHHLQYFWMVAKEGSVAAAARRLHVTQPTISGQVRQLEISLGDKLFRRSGRGLALTETGRTVLRYADDIFALGSDLVEEVRGGQPRAALRLNVGVADVLPKLVVYRLLEPVLSMQERPVVTCFEGKTTDLLPRVSRHDLDVVLVDASLPPHLAGGAFSHRLGESPLAVFGTEALAKQFRAGFPQSLNGAPMLLPTSNTMVRRNLDRWFESRSIRPSVRAEFEDSALLKVFGQAGEGLFVSPAVIAEEVKAQYDVRILGRIPEVSEQFFAISMERRIRHPAVAALTDFARTGLLAKPRAAKPGVGGRSAFKARRLAR